MGLLYVKRPCTHRHVGTVAMMLFAMGEACTRMAACPCGRRDGSCRHLSVE